MTTTFSVPPLEDTEESTYLEPVTRLRRDLLAAASELSNREAGYLVDAYYTMQDARKAGDQRRAALEAHAEPSRVIAWLADQDRTLEAQIKRALDRYSMAQHAGQWARSQVGIGPVIAAGLLAHIDFGVARTAGDVWRFAGLDPTSRWEKGQKRPWNASLKVLAWKIGDSFKKFSNHPRAFYGPIYRHRKEYEVRKNEAGDYADQAARVLTERRIQKPEARAFYESGRLSPGHIDQRAMRYAAKLFLGHYFEVGYELHHGTKPPVPFAIGHLGHAHYIPPPLWPMAE